MLRPEDTGPFSPCWHHTRLRGLTQAPICARHRLPGARCRDTQVKTRLISAPCFLSSVDKQGLQPQIIRPVPLCTHTFHGTSESAFLSQVQLPLKSVASFASRRKWYQSWSNSLTAARIFSQLAHFSKEPWPYLSLKTTLQIRKESSSPGNKPQLTPMAAATKGVAFFA